MEVPAQRFSSYQLAFSPTRHQLASTCSSYVTPFSLNDPCQYTTLLNLRPLIFGLTPFGWLCSITLTPTYSTITYGNIVFHLRPHFQEN